MFIKIPVIECPNANTKANSFIIINTNSIHCYEKMNNSMIDWLVDRGYTRESLKNATVLSVAIRRNDGTSGQIFTSLTEEELDQILETENFMDILAIEEYFRKISES